MDKTILFAANRGYALTSSREAIIMRFLEMGWRVVIATANDYEALRLKACGAILEAVTFDHGGITPYEDLHAWCRMLAIYNRWQPAVAHQFHAKPVIIGTIAARSIQGSGLNVINTITGLGQTFISGRPSSCLARLGYRVALRRSDVTIFQNRDDMALFLDRGWVNKNSGRLIVGSGVDLSRFEFIDRRGRNNVAPVVIMLGRLLRQKGIPEFVEVAQRIRHRWPAARFLIAGEEVPDHPDAVTIDWVCEQNGVKYLGHLQDVRPILAKADLLLYPSYYREGVPRVVMEAAATGLPTVAFNVPGVREAVRNGETGYLVPKGNAKALQTRVEELLKNEALRLRMGRAGRIMVEKFFDVRKIQKQYFDIYRELGFDV